MPKDVFISVTGAVCSMQVGTEAALSRGVRRGPLQHCGKTETITLRNRTIVSKLALLINAELSRVSSGTHSGLGEQYGHEDNSEWYKGYAELCYSGSCCLYGVPSRVRHRWSATPEGTSHNGLP